MIVIAIIGILAAIAIPQFLAYRSRGYSASAQSSVRNAYTAAQAFYSDSPTGTVTVALLTQYGFGDNPNVTLTIGNGGISTLDMTAVHTGGGSSFEVDYTGGITRS